MKSRKYISCQIFKPYLERLLKQTEQALDIEFIEIEAHNEPQKLRNTLQSMIDANQDKDEIILLYGICGNATEGLRSEKSELILFRVHDCLAVLLGSNDRYREAVEIQKTGIWRCEGNASVYLQRYDQTYYEYVQKFGEDNARYLMSVLHPDEEKVTYVSFGTEADQENINTSKQAGNITVLEGDTKLLEDMLLQKENDMIAHIRAGRTVRCLYDYGVVLTESS